MVFFRRSFVLFWVEKCARKREEEEEEKERRTMKCKSITNKNSYVTLIRCYSMLNLKSKAIQRVNKEFHRYWNDQAIHRL